MIHGIRYKIDQETRFSRFLDSFFVDAQFYAYLKEPTDVVVNENGNTRMYIFDHRASHQGSQIEDIRIVGNGLDETISLHT